MVPAVVGRPQSPVPLGIFLLLPCTQRKGGGDFPFSSSSTTGPNIRLSQPVHFHLLSRLPLFLSFPSSPTQSRHLEKPKDSPPSDLFSSTPQPTKEPFTILQQQQPLPTIFFTFNRTLLFPSPFSKPKQIFPLSPEQLYHPNNKKTQASSSPSFFLVSPHHHQILPHGPTTSLKISQNREPQGASGALIHIPNRQIFPESCTRTQPSPASTAALSSAPAAITDSHPLNQSRY